MAIALEVINLIADLKGIVGTNQSVILLMGGTSLNDFANGIFKYDPASTATPDDIDSIKPNAITLPAAGRWIRQKLPGATIGRAYIIHNADITFGATNTAQALPLNTNTLIQGFISHDTVTNNSRVVANKTGSFIVAGSAQIIMGGILISGLFNIWGRINGVDIASSRSVVMISTGDDIAVPFIFGANVNAGDYIEVMASVTNTNISLDANGTGAGGPAAPAVKVNAFLYNNFPM